MKYNVFSVALLVIVVSFICATTALALPPQNITESGVALHGYDPVSYHRGTAKKGSEHLTSNYDGAIYYFSSEQNQKVFQSQPQSYQPAFGGWCAWAMLEGEKVDVDPEKFKIVDGKTFLFYNSFFTDTLKKWNNLSGSIEESDLAAKAERNWQRLLSGK